MWEWEQVGDSPSPGSQAGQMWLLGLSTPGLDESEINQSTLLGPVHFSGTQELGLIHNPTDPRDVFETATFGPRRKINP